MSLSLSKDRPKAIVMCFMYILRCSNGLYYVGSTLDLDKRLKEHQFGEGGLFTKKHLPVELVYYEKFQHIEEAFWREQQIKGWSRKKKEALINGHQDELPELSKSKSYD